MILGTPSPEQPEPTLRVVRIVTVDSNGDLRRWKPAHLARQHPEAFGQLFVRLLTDPTL